MRIGCESPVLIFVRVRVVALEQLQTIAIVYPSSTEVDTLVGPGPLELVVHSADEFLVGAARASPDLQFRAICARAVGNIDALQRFWCPCKTESIKQAHFVAEDFDGARSGIDPDGPSRVPVLILEVLLRVAVVDD
jgi:hypothetical protein